MVPKVGLEPTRGRPHQILSLACLPIPPFWLIKSRRIMVHWARVELARVASPPPQDGVSTNSTTSAKPPPHKLH